MSLTAMVKNIFAGAAMVVLCRAILKQEKIFFFCHTAPLTVAASIPVLSKDWFSIPILALP